MATMKAGNVLDPDCPSRLVLDRIAEKWTGLVVLALGRATLRFGELRERIGGVAPKVLTQTLRALERDGLLTRTVYAEVPPRVEYTLTAARPLAARAADASCRTGPSATSSTVMANRARPRPRG